MVLFALPALPVVGKFVFSVISGVLLSELWDNVPGFSGTRGCGRLPFNVTGLTEDLEQRVFGQHLARDLIPSFLNEHINGQPNKALLLSFHGLSGTGKTLVSQLVAERLFKDGMDSSCVHRFVASLHFPEHAKKMEYQAMLRQKVLEKLRKDGRSLFIFDEVNQMPCGLMDVLQPFVDHSAKVDGVETRRAVFMMLGLDGAKEITKHMLNHWKEGGARGKVNHKELVDELTKDIFYSEGSLHKSILISQNLVSFIPFLPLEARHVRQCIHASLTARGKILDEAAVTQLMEQLLFIPKDSKLFSASGCKKVEEILTQNL